METPLEGNGVKGTGKEGRQWPWSGSALIEPLNISIAELRDWGLGCGLTLTKIAY